jgi:hypothetical protein
MVKAIPKLDVSRLIQRISGLVVTPEPNAVVLDFATNLPTSPIVEIYSLVKSPSGELVFDGGGAELLAVGFNFLPTPGSTQHHARLTRLQQRRQCMYRITAGGGVLGGLAVVTGEFTTGRRDATVTVREILMFTDGDSGLGGSGELSFDFGVYDEDDNRVAPARVLDVDLRGRPAQSPLRQSSCHVLAVRAGLAVDVRARHRVRPGRVRVRGGARRSVDPPQPDQGLRERRRSGR